MTGPQPGSPEVGRAAPPQQWSAQQWPPPQVPTPPGPPTATPWGPQGGPPAQWAPPPWAAQPPPPPPAWPQYPAQPPFPAPNAGAPFGAFPCRVCGGAPALDCTVRGHVGMILLMSWRSTRGPFCRTCGTSVLRRMTATTLALGWWGVISLIVGTPFALISNLVTASRLRALPPPGPHGPQLDPGKPLYLRPAAYVPVAVVLLIVVLALVAH